MRRWLIGLVAGLACAAGISAYAVTAGGFPSFPWFQAVGVGEAPPATPGNAAISGNVSAGSIFANGAQSCTIPAGTVNGTAACLVGNGTGAPALVIGGSATSGESNGLNIWAGTSTADHPIQVTSEAGGKVFFAIDGLGNVVFPNSPSFSIDGMSVPLAAAGQFSGSSGGCALQNSGWGQIEIASCARNSVGNYTVTFSAAFPKVPTCVANGNGVSGSPLWAQAVTGLVGSVNVDVYAGTTPTDGQFTLECMSAP